MEGLNTKLNFFLCIQSPDIRLLLTDRLTKSNHKKYWEFEQIPILLAHIHLRPDLILLEGEFNQFPLSLSIIKKEAPFTQIIFISQNPTIEEAFRLGNMGVNAYWSTELDLSVLIQKQVILIQEQLEKGVEQQESIVDRFRNLGFIGNSRILQKIYHTIEKAANTLSPVIINGELGTGKNLVANTLHILSPCNSANYQYIDISSIPKEMLEQELFGCEKGVFKGNLKRQIGQIEKASGGSLVINAPELMPFEVQIKLLRAIKEQKFIRPGGSNIVFFNARIIICTKKDLKKQVKIGTFNEGLFHILNNISIKMPPLRTRRQDIITLANYFLRDFVQRNKLKALSFSSNAKERLSSYTYPGNIYELRSIVEASALMVNGTEISQEDLIFTQETEVDSWLDEELTLQEFINKIIYYYLERYDNNVNLVAQKLAIGKSTIYRILKTNKQKS